MNGVLPNRVCFNLLEQIQQLNKQNHEKFYKGDIKGDLSPDSLNLTV